MYVCGVTPWTHNSNYCSTLLSNVQGIRIFVLYLMEIFLLAKSNMRSVIELPEILGLISWCEACHDAFFNSWCLTSSHATTRVLMWLLTSCVCVCAAYAAHTHIHSLSTSFFKSCACIGFEEVPQSTGQVLGPDEHSSFSYFSPEHALCKGNRVCLQPSHVWFYSCEVEAQFCQLSIKGCHQNCYIAE